MLRNKIRSFLLSLAVPAAVVAVPVLAPSTALADAPAAAAPQPRSAFSAPFQRYLLAPNGKTMGLMLADGTFVGTPGHSLPADAPALQTGTKLDIEGVVKATPTGKIVQRAVVKVGGNVLADASKAHGRHAHRGQGHHGEGKEHHKKHAELKPVTGAGQIAAIVSGPKGRIHALVLTDGTTAVGHGLDAMNLKVGDKISVAGMGGVYPLGKSVRVEKLTMPDGSVRDIPRPAPRQPDAQPGQGPV